MIAAFRAGWLAFRSARNGTGLHPLALPGPLGYGLLAGALTMRTAGDLRDAVQLTCAILFTTLALRLVFAVVRRRVRDEVESWARRAGEISAALLNADPLALLRRPFRDMDEFDRQWVGNSLAVWALWIALLFGPLLVRSR